jgi:hypothetical protein
VSDGRINQTNDTEKKGQTNMKATGVMAAVITTLITKMEDAYAASVVEKNEVEKKDKRQEAIEAALANEAFGCHTEKAIKLVEALTGLKLDVPKDPGNYPPRFHPPRFLVVVPTTNAKSNHRHEIGKPVVILGKNMSYGFSLPGTCLNSVCANECRPATGEEFKGFIDAIKDDSSKLESWIAGRCGIAELVD